MPVSEAAWLTPVMAVVTDWVPRAASWALRAISLVAADCSFRLGAPGGLLDVAGDLVGGRRLLLHGAGDGGGNVGHLIDAADDLGDGGHRLLGGGLDGTDLVADLVGSLGGLVG